MRPFVPYGPPRFRHQREGLQKLVDTRGVCALLFDPGTGKTGVTLDYLSVLAQGWGRQVRALVLAPIAALDSWVQQPEKFVDPSVGVWSEIVGGTVVQKAATIGARGPSGSGAPDLNRSEAVYIHGPGGREVDPDRGPAEVGGEGEPSIVLVAANLDILASRRRVTKSLTALDRVIQGVRRFSPDVIVIDESHRIKGPSSNVSAGAARLGKLTDRRIILTGTVNPHSPLDTWSQWRFLQPTAFLYRLRDGSTKPMSFGDFRHRYARLGGWMGKQVVGFQRLDEMQDIMARNSIVARKADVLDLPPVTEATVRVKLSDREQAAYEEMRRSLAVRLQSGELAVTGNRLTQILRLRQITAGHLPVVDLSEKGQETVRLETIGDSKARAIADLVNTSLEGESRVVVFSFFSHEISRLAELLQKKGTRVETVSGATPEAERRSIRERFGSDDPSRIVLIAQLKTLSLGVNELVTASHVVFSSLSHQRDDYVQARDRLDRQGQTRPVTVWHAVAPGTVDEVILESHRRRTSLEDAVLRHIADAPRA